jgi:hypothetical protein
MTTTTSFWKNAAACLPPEARRRYAADFEAAERFELLLDLGIEACGIATRALAKGCRRSWNADPSQAGDTGTI